MSSVADGRVALQSAQAALQRGDMAAAMSAAQRALAANSMSVDAWWALGTAANALNDLATAERAFAEAARHAPPGTPTRSQMLALRAKPLINDGRPAEAVATIRAAIAAGIKDIDSLVLACYTLTHAGLPQEALPLALKATQLDPRNTNAWYGLGNVRVFLGDIVGAQVAFETAIAAADGHFVAAYYDLAQLRRWSTEQNHIAVLEAMQCRNSMEACRVGFALFKEYDDVGDTAAAWDCLQHGASLAKKMECWSSADEAAIVQAWQQHFPLQRFDVRDDRPRSGPKRIFIVGLPRSGTTLVERILTSHSQVQAIGEVKTFGLAVRRLANVASPALLDPDVIAAAAQLDPLEIAELYTRDTAYLSDGSAYTIDKRPRNHEYAGLIRLAFPDALIIGLDRNPMDSLFGAYKQLFIGAHGWSYAQDDLADHYHHFRELMNHWRQVFGNDSGRNHGNGLIEVSLEALIKDPDTQIRCLLDACELPFEEACLSPHESKGAVTTASAVQVRKPINASGVGAWKRYERQLAPLFQRLMDMGYRP